MVTWNVLTLSQPGSKLLLAREVKKYKVTIALKHIYLVMVRSTLVKGAHCFGLVVTRNEEALA